MRKIFFILMLVLLEGGSLYADPAVLETIRGLGPVVKDQNYNPIVGAISKPYLKELRYNGYYGTLDQEQTNPLLKCIVKNVRNQAYEPINNPNVPEFKPNNCPQDVVTALIQWLFPNSTMDGNFAPNRRDPSFQDLVSRFTPTTVGAILNVLYKARGNYNENLRENIEFAVLNDYKKQKIQEESAQGINVSQEPNSSIEEETNNLYAKYTKVIQEEAKKNNNGYDTLEKVMEYQKQYNNLQKEEQKKRREENKIK